MSEGPMEPHALAWAVSEAGPEVLVPERLRGSAELPSGLTLTDQLPLGPGLVLAVLTGKREVVVAPLVAEGGRVRRAGAGSGAFEAVLRVMRSGAPQGRFEAESFGPIGGLRGERRVDVDQSNDSFVVGEGAVVKLYPRTVPGAQPGLDIPTHLRAVGFSGTPELLGALTWRSPDDGTALLATAATYLPGASDGWDWYVELLDSSLDGGADAVGPAEAIGALVARLHTALATPSEVFPQPVREATPAEAQGWRARAVATLEEALAVTAGQEGERLGGLAARARSVLASMKGQGSSVMRIHGDLHVGQILSWDGGLAVGDFDGNPLAPAEVRVAPDTPMRDVASMARALDHVGRIVQRRRPERVDQVGSWIARARTAFLDAYRSQMRAAGDPVPFVEGLLLPLEVAQECHEYVYSARYLPRWLYVPDLAMPALLQGDSVS